MLHCSIASPIVSVFSSSSEWTTLKHFWSSKKMKKKTGNKNGMYTANVYRDLRVLYREIRMRGFQIYGDYILPTIPVKISCKVKKKKKDLLCFSNLFSNFLTIFARISNLRKIYMHVTGYPVRHKDFLYFLYKKIAV